MTGSNESSLVYSCYSNGLLCIIVVVGDQLVTLSKPSVVHRWVWRAAVGGERRGATAARCTAAPTAPTPPLSSPTSSATHGFTRGSGLLLAPTVPTTPPLKITSRDTSWLTPGRNLLPVLTVRIDPYRKFTSLPIYGHTTTILIVTACQM